MPLETASYPTDLVSSNPAPTDPTNQGDDHVRLMKSVIKNAMPGVNAAFTRVIGTSFGLMAGAGIPTSGLPGFGFISTPNLGWYDLGGSTIRQSGHLQVDGNGSFGGTLGVAGAFSAASASIAGAVNAGSFSTTGSASFGALSGSTGTFSGAVSAASFSAPSASITTLTATTVIGALPAGAIMDFAGPTAPTGWASCDGGLLSRTSYPQLFAAIGTTWGAGDGATTFGVPNFLGRFRRHRDASVFSGNVGNSQGPANLAHTHTYSGTSSDVSNGHTHSFSGTSSGQSNGHTHGYSGTSGANSVDHTHTYSGTSGVMSANAAHTHALGSAQSVFLTSVNNGTGTNQGNVMVTGGGVSAGLTTSSVNIDHTHTYSGATSGASVGHTHDYSGATGATSADHSHTYSGTTAGVSAGHTHTYSGTTSSQGDANECRPYSATVLTCIKLFN